MVEKLINWLLPVFIIIIILALQYFISYFKGGKWRYLIPVLFLIILIILLSLHIITFASFMIYLIIGIVFLGEQGHRGQRDRNQKQSHSND